MCFNIISLNSFRRYFFKQLWLLEQKMLFGICKNGVRLWCWIRQLTLKAISRVSRKWEDRVIFHVHHSFQPQKKKTLWNKLMPLPNSTFKTRPLNNEPNIFEDMGQFYIYFKPKHSKTSLTLKISLWIFMSSHPLSLCLTKMWCLKKFWNKHNPSF